MSNQISLIQTTGKKEKAGRKSADRQTDIYLNYNW